MTIQYNGSNIKDLYYNGQKIKEAYYNGEKVYQSRTVLYETTWYCSNENTNLYLPYTFPAGTIIEWEGAVADTYSKVYYGNSDHRILPGTTTRMVAEVPFSGLWCGIEGGGFTPSVTFHIRLLQGD